MLTCRETPRDKAKDKDAFDAAVAVRPPLLIGTSAALGDARDAFVQAGRTEYEPWARAQQAAAGAACDCIPNARSHGVVRPAVEIVGHLVHA
jgi:hypothetical protein